MNEKRLQELEKSIDKLRLVEKRISTNSNRIGILRALLFFSIVILLPVSYLSFSLLSSLIILIPVSVSFILTSISQTRLLNFLKLVRHWIDIKKSFICRINLDWENINSFKLHPNSKQILIETDFDLTGDRSLHQLIDFSLSAEGSRLLREFLVNPDLNEEEIIQKQNIVREIFSLNKFREKFILTLSLVSNKQLDSSVFIKWINKNSVVRNFKGYIFFITFLSITNLLFITLASADILQNYWAISFLLYFAFYSLGNKYYRGLSQDADIIKDELGKYSRILEFIENYKFKNGKNLERICEPIQDKNVSPTYVLNKTFRLVSFLTFRTNPIVWGAFISIFPFDFYLAFFLQKYKTFISLNLEKWLSVFYNLEAYVSLANYAYLNPEYKFPKIVKDNFKFSANELGHPLIKYQKRVKNSFEIKNIGEAYIITGSNMSGKSTFLRTLGINTCLAYAGAPVNANSFSLSAVKLFSCIKVSDSVIDGISYFYSEVKRLKELLDLINDNNSKPILYLIDEIFKGTNNIERRIGSSAYIKSLVGENCTGLISTHDIELVNLADDNKFIFNYHFKEEVQKDKMIFDYKLREGPCPTTNALKIMKIEGLPVD